MKKDAAVIHHIHARISTFSDLVWSVNDAAFTKEVIIVQFCWPLLLSWLYKNRELTGTMS